MYHRITRVSSQKGTIHIMASSNRRVKSFDELSPSMQRRIMRTLRVDNPKQAARILRDMERRGVSRKRLRGHAPESKAKPAKPAKVVPVKPKTLREKQVEAAEYIARTLDRPDALYMLVANSEYMPEEDVYRAMMMDEEQLRNEASRPPQDYGNDDVQPFWYHPTAYDSAYKWSA